LRKSFVLCGINPGDGFVLVFKEDLTYTDIDPEVPGSPTPYPTFGTPTTTPATPTSPITPTKVPSSPPVEAGGEVDVQGQAPGDASSSGHSLSAGGIVGIVIAVIVAAVAAYYVTITYFKKAPPLEPVSFQGNANEKLVVASYL